MDIIIRPAETSDFDSVVTGGLIFTKKVRIFSL